MTRTSKNKQRDEDIESWRAGEIERKRGKENKRNRDTGR